MTSRDYIITREYLEIKLQQLETELAQHVVGEDDHTFISGKIAAYEDLIDTVNGGFQSTSEQGAAIAERFKKIIDFKELKLPSNSTLAGNLDMSYGIPLRAKYFGTGVSSKYIRTWDQLLYALDAARPETDRYSSSLKVRTDSAEALSIIMKEYKQTNRSEE